MKLNIAFTYHYIIFLSLALFLVPGTLIIPSTKTKKIKIEKNEPQRVANENTEELLHGDILFRY
ncbi:MAG: hypothetical protein ACR2KZ_14710 [Segetibacter sp.]